MKKQLLITTILAILIIWAGTAMANNRLQIGKIPVMMIAPADQYQSGPMDSVLVIKGKINMGNTDYYSVFPNFEGGLLIDGKPFGSLLQELGANKIEYVPQFKSSASSGWTIYFSLATGANPSSWDKFKAITNVTVVSVGAVQVEYQQNGSSVALYVTPGQGTQITKPLGPVKSK